MHAGGRARGRAGVVACVCVCVCEQWDGIGVDCVRSK